MAYQAKPVRSACIGRGIFSVFKVVAAVVFTVPFSLRDDD